MNLFDHARERLIEKEQPLAARLRPRTLDEFVGQAHILAPGRLLRRAIQADQLSSLIFYGPPGTGKTTLAMVIANTTRSHFEVLNAVLAGVKDIRRVSEEAQERRGQFGRRTILFVDEVHRWNKAQQDALLPWVENGTVVLIGATTENPYFTVNRALVSRSRIFQLQPLTAADLRQAAAAALSDAERGYGKLQIELAEAALKHLVEVANGDCRALLNALELAVETTEADAGGIVHIDLAVAEESIQKRAVLYDKEGDYHFDTISAFIKSLRGSDPDAALYWLAKMVYAGEDPRFLLRRLLIFCGEDIGMADPQALAVTAAAAEAFDRVGMPEGAYHLSMVTVYLATAPKSNSSMAFFDALRVVEKEREGEVPNHLKDGSRDQEGFGHGVGYLYPHAYQDHWVAQQYLPSSLQGKLFYEPGALGYEKEIAENVARQREAQLAATLALADDGGAPAEILTYSPVDRVVDQWLVRTTSGLSRNLADIRDRIFAGAKCLRHFTVLDLAGDSGLLTWEALRQAPEGGVFTICRDRDAAATLSEQAERLPLPRRPLIVAGADELPADVAFDLIVGYNAWRRTTDRQTAIAETAARLAPAGKLIFAEAVPALTQRLYALVPLAELDPDVAARLRQAEEDIYADANPAESYWQPAQLAAWVTAAGLVAELEIISYETQRMISVAHLDRWFAAPTDAGRTTYAGHLARQLSAAELSECEALFRRSLQQQTVTWQTQLALLRANRSSRDFRD